MKWLDECTVERGIGSSVQLRPGRPGFGPPKPDPTEKYRNPIQPDPTRNFAKKPVEKSRAYKAT